jgi:hypothetical protein
VGLPIGKTERYHNGTNKLKKSYQKICISQKVFIPLYHNPKIIKVMERKIEMPVKTSTKKRPNKTYIMKMAEVKGGLSENERTQLATLRVKNAMQRVNNKAMSDKESNQLTTEQNIALQILMTKFANDIEQVLKK